MVYQQVGIFLLFLLASGAKIQQVQGEDQNPKSNLTSSLPYLDDSGNLCQDKVETFQDTQYETMIQCRVAMKKSCSQREWNPDSEDENSLTEPQEACHTVYDKKCKTVYRPHRSKVRVRVCPDGEVDVAKRVFQSLMPKDDETENNIVLDVRPDPTLPLSPKIAKKCHKGRRTVCSTKYHTECTTQQVQQTMQEDHPKCQVEMVEKCTVENEPKKCRRVPAMRCKIEKRTVVKTKPESKCSRVPRQFCRKEDCVETVNGEQNPDDLQNEDNNLFSNDQNCYYRNQIVNEILPEEKCSLIPKQMCHSVKKSSNSLRRRRRRKARSASPAGGPSQLSFLRRHYLSRAARRRQMLPRKSRNFQETTTPKPIMQQVCKSSPEQVCEKKRVNPRVVEKQMVKKFCREPRRDSYFDQLLVARLKQEQTFDP